MEITLKWIKDYIFRKYPDSCLARNYKENYCNEQLMKECEDFFYYEKLGYCRCGNPEDVKKVIKDYLKVVSETSDKRREKLKKRFSVEAVYDNELLLCLAYAVDAAGFTEHGSSVYSAWLTTEGEMFLWLLERSEEIEWQ